ncbi:hypothetical protein BDV25DRAFT_48132 [Aspergillus avenaceus]|uniref:Uncharacterized protein n=1 Tax=Aspergillus avenaceus TaxID=36643 RepID=A0A5N6U3A1_ASPAV|nr:hypothetical protein BDV25DRAFT_48132 [Aspergillus avenaceus]
MVEECVLEMESVSVSSGLAPRQVSSKGKSSMCIAVTQHSDVNFNNPIFTSFFLFSFFIIAFLLVLYRFWLDYCNLYQNGEYRR